MKTTAISDDARYPMRINPGPERARRLAEEVIPPNLPALGRLMLPGNWNRNWARDFGGSMGLLVRLSLPAMVGMMVQSAYFFIDRAFVGKALDLDAGAGIMIAFPYMLALQAASMLIGLGGRRGSRSSSARRKTRRRS